MDPKIKTLVALLRAENISIKKIFIDQGIYVINIEYAPQIIEKLEEIIGNPTGSLQHDVIGNEIEILLPVALDVEMLNTIHKSRVWDLNPNTDRSIDIEKAAKHLQTISDSKLKWATEQVIKNTTHVTFDDFSKDLNLLANKLPAKFNLFLDSLKIGSEHMCVMLVWPLIKSRIVKVINRYYDLDNEYPLVMFDDAMYTGTNVACLLGAFNREYNESKIGDCVKITVGTANTVINRALENEIIVVCPYVNEQADRLISHLNEETDLEIKLYTSCITRPMAEILMEPKKRQKYKFNKITAAVSYMQKSFDTIVGCAMYFDHKIANKYGSFTELYEKIVKNPPSRELIEYFEMVLLKVDN